ncbi:MAG: hypothetical protein M5R40_04600 [Anaerolineae bacterium]|nr:hypothetical protein [Anaerolineae bacterium]
MRTGEPRADVLNSRQRVGALLIAAGMLLLAGFFVAHQATNTGFFTARFGAMEAILLYGPILLSIIDFVVQAVTGRRNPARPFEVASGLLLGLAALWFLIVFPFDFSHLADALPEGVRFLLAWVTDDIGKIPLVIQLFAGPINAFQAIRAYRAGLG